MRRLALSVAAPAWFSRMNSQANSPFSYAAPLNETVMVGTVAQRLPGRERRWKAGSLTFDSPEATAFVRRSYRKGWEIDALKA